MLYFEVIIKDTPWYLLFFIDIVKDWHTLSTCLQSYYSIVPISMPVSFSPCCRLQMDLTQVSLRYNWNSVDQSQSPLLSNRAQRDHLGRQVAATEHHQWTTKERSVGRVRKKHPSTYHPTVWSSSTSVLWPQPERSLRACWRSSWFWTIPVNLHCIGRHTVTGRVSTNTSSLWLIHRKQQMEWTALKMFFFLSDLFQKLPQSERPLLLRLIAGPDPEQLSFVLKENETSEVEVRKHTNAHIELFFSYWNSYIIYLSWKGEIQAAEMIYSLKDI